MVASIFIVIRDGHGAFVRPRSPYVRVHENSMGSEVSFWARKAVLCWEAYSACVSPPSPCQSSLFMVDGAFVRSFWTMFDFGGTFAVHAMATSWWRIRPPFTCACWAWQAVINYVSGIATS